MAAPLLRVVGSPAASVAALPALAVSGPAALYFSPVLAQRLGLEEAVFLAQLHYWLTRSGAHERDGRRWVYNTLAQWCEQFPFWKKTTLHDIIGRLESKRIVLSTAKYNRSGMDRTKWYAIDYQHEAVRDVFAMDAAISDFPEMQHPFPGNRKCISGNPDSNTRRLPTETTYNEEDEANASAADEPPAVPEPQPKRPRSEKQQAADNVYRRRLAVYHAWCRGIGLDPESEEAEVGKRLALREIKGLEAGDLPRIPDIEACARFLTAQDWRDNPPGLTLVVKEFPKWAAKGKPERPAPKTPGSDTMMRPSGTTQNVPRTTEDAEAIRERTRRHMAELDAARSARGS